MKHHPTLKVRIGPKALVQRYRLSVPFPLPIDGYGFIRNKEVGDIDASALPFMGHVGSVGDYRATVIFKSLENLILYLAHIEPKCRIEEDVRMNDAPSLN